MKEKNVGSPEQDAVTDKTGNNAEDSRSIEELFEELEGVIGSLEEGGSSLEDSFRHYERGMELVKACAGKIDQVEKQILVLEETGGDYGV